MRVRTDSCLCFLELENQKVLEWLADYADDSRKKLQSLIRDTVPGTGKWLLESDRFIEFVKGNERASLWCEGLPGAGKTYLS